MARDKFVIFLLISILIHILLIFTINNKLIFKDTKILKKNKDKNITKVSFIDLPDNLKEKKHNEKTKYIAQKSFKAEKETKKNNPLQKPKPVKPKKTKPKVAIVKEKIPILPSDKVNKNRSKQSSKKSSKKTSKIEKHVKKIEKKFNNKKILKQRKQISLNKVTPSFEELLEKGLIPKNTLNKRQPKSKKNQKKPLNSKNFKDNDVQKLSPNIFQPSHIYPDDIDISDSVSISTQSSRFASYLHKVKRKIELVWEYPRIAGEMGIGGRLFVKFTISKTGKLKKVELLKSSGASILDNEAIRAIKEAAPYPPFPKDNSFGVNEIKIHACFDYIISGRELW